MASGSGRTRTTVSGARIARGRETRDYIRSVRQSLRSGAMTREQARQELAFARDYIRNG